MQKISSSTFGRSCVMSADFVVMTAAAAPSSIGNQYCGTVLVSSGLGMMILCILCQPGCGRPWKKLLDTFLCPTISLLQLLSSACLKSKLIVELLEHKWECQPRRSSRACCFPLHYVMGWAVGLIGQSLLRLCPPAPLISQVVG